MKALTPGATDFLLDDWRHEPLTAFLGYAASADFRLSSNAVKQPETDLRQNSLHVYRAMFLKYLDFLEPLNVRFVDAGQREIHLFFGSMADNTQETIWRYVRLLERVYQYLADNLVTTSNPVTEWVQQRIAAGESPKVGRRSPPPDKISPQQVEVLQDWLYEAGRQALHSGDWKLGRDITLASVSIGTGMRCTELVKLERERVTHRKHAPLQERFEFHLVATVPSAPQHRTMAEEACVDLMEIWWAMRWGGFPRPPQDTGRGPLVIPAYVVGGEPREYVFPATKVGTPLKAGTVFKNLKKLAPRALEEGALSAETAWVLQRGAQGLRRAYALSSVLTGRDDQLTAFRMGLWEKRSLRRYKEQLQQLGVRVSKARGESGN